MAVEGITSSAELLRDEKSAGDAIENAIKMVEDFPFYKSVGYGGLPNEECEVELDAAYMDGDSLSIGAIAGIKDFKNPISIARKLSNEQVNCFLQGLGAEAFAHKNGFERVNMLTDRAKLHYEKKRREIAKVALERLILDGRINPSRIEEMLMKAEDEVEQRIIEDGQRAIEEVGIHNLHPQLVRLVGKLKFRTSYGQNVLKHSIEVAKIAGMLAQELGLDDKDAKRGGLLHDLGKAIDHEVEGTHISIGVEAAKKYGENKNVINCIESHHGDVEANCIAAILVQASDAISAARPGARRESLENYIKRLENLEEIANSFDGIEKTFAVQAGRELRVMIKPEKISDDQMVVIAREIAQKIENELEYPGQIKVNVIRESKAIEYAK
ncbi:MAG: isoaspartyl peptidase/L-asparaginase [Anaerococcus sp.]|nr:isoaspartyl peptidase/L-asparaginase [Anaerococcus sp.]